MTENKTVIVALLSVNKLTLIFLLPLLMFSELIFNAQQTKWQFDL